MWNSQTVCWNVWKVFLNFAPYIFISLSQTTRLLKLRRNVVKLSLYQHFTNTLIFSVVGEFQLLSCDQTRENITFVLMRPATPLWWEVLSLVTYIFLCLHSFHHIHHLDYQSVQAGRLSEGQFFCDDWVMRFIAFTEVSCCAQMKSKLWICLSFVRVLQGWRDLWVDDAFWRLLFSTILLVIMVLLRPSANSQRSESVWNLGAEKVAVWVCGLWFPLCFASSQVLAFPSDWWGWGRRWGQRTHAERGFW